MKRIPLSRLFPLGIALALALPARGQAASAPPAPATWVMSIHVGAGNLKMDGDSLGRDSGTMTQLRLGHVVAPGVVAGFQARGWGGTKSGLSRQVQVITVNATGYLPGRGFYGRAGAGVCAVRQEFLAPGATASVWSHDGGFAATAAAGFDLRIKRMFGVGADVEYARVVAAHLGGNLVTGALGLNIYW